jgi:putative phosphoribosyl transferase
MATTRDAGIPAGPVRLDGRLEVPEGAVATIVFAHGPGSSRASPRNGHVASFLRSQGFATLLFDLLTTDEARDSRKVFEVALLADRLAATTTWVQTQPETARLPIGVFGASTGAAAALIAAAGNPAIRAVVSRSGRPDLAAAALHQVTAPTLLVVGSRDTAVLDLNEVAYEHLRGVRELRIVPGAGHLFEEPGTLDEVAGLAATWFRRHLAGRLAVAALVAAPRPPRNRSRSGHRAIPS